MVKKIIYRSENDATSFDMERFLKSLNKYGEVTAEQVNNELEHLPYDPMHVSCLIEIGAKLIPDDEKAKEYFETHLEWFDTVQTFERLRRITGYLVGTLSRWNDAKQAEEKARVKHDITKDNQYTQESKDYIEQEKLDNSIASQI